MDWVTLVKRGGSALGRWGVSVAALIAASLPAAASADTMRDALIQAYSSNPTLTGQRAKLRSTDENVQIQRAAGLPNLSSEVDYDDNVKRSANDFTSPKHFLEVQANLSVPIYQGGSVRNSVAAAKARVAEGRQTLRSVEADVFTQTVSAYMNVLRDTAIVDLNQGNVKVLETDLQSNRDRFQVGDLTRTDVAQSEARLAVARAQLESVQAQLDASRQNYLQVVGKFPDNLQPPPPLPALPTTSEDAVDVAVANNPDLAAAKEESKAADYDIGVAKSYRLPRIEGTASGQYYDFGGTLGGNVPGLNLSQTDKTATIGVRATLPLYQGGMPAARVRQAQANKSAAIEAQTAAERQVVSDARTFFSRYQAALSVIDSSERSVKANELALEGVRAEQSVGTRTVLEVLNAEQELLNSRSTLVTAKREAYVAGFSLLQAMGKAEAKDLGLDGGPLYDPTVNYKRVHAKYWDWGSDPKPKPVATSTIGQPSVSAVPPHAPVATPEN
jgi:outer membrane protein